MYMYMIVHVRTIILLHDPQQKAVVLRIFEAVVTEEQLARLLGMMAQKL